MNGHLMKLKSFVYTAMHFICEHYALQVANVRTYLHTTCTTIQANARMCM